MKTETYVVVEKEIRNIASRFHKAVYKINELPRREFKSVTEAGKVYKLANCVYAIYRRNADGSETLVRRNERAMVDGYGRRIK